MIHRIILGSCFYCFQKQSWPSSILLIVLLFIIIITHILSKSRWRRHNGGHLSADWSSLTGPNMNLWPLLLDKLDLNHNRNHLTSLHLPLAMAKVLHGRVDSSSVSRETNISADLGVGDNTV